MSKRHILFFETSAVSTTAIDNIGAVLSSPKIFIDFSGDQEVIDILEKNGFVTCGSKLHQYHNPDQFLREFINMIDSQALKNHNLCWWTSELATRNHFLTHLATQLDQLLIINRVIEIEEYSVLVIAGVDPIIRSWLRGFLRTRDVILHERKYFPLLDRLHLNVFMQIASASKILRETLSLSIRIVYTDRVLNNSRRARFLQKRPFTVIKTLTRTRSLMTGFLES